MDALRKALGFWMAALLLLGASATAQFIPNGPRHPAADKTPEVEYVYPEQVRLPAGKASLVTLHFLVAPGLHINSHTPSGSFLIPTIFTIPAGAGARLESASYPPGTTITLPADPTMKISAYTGRFAIETHLIAERGNHLVKGLLRYQACDQTQCMPPKSIPVAIDVIGR